MFRVYVGNVIRAEGDGVLKGRKYSGIVSLIDFMACLFSRVLVGSLSLISAS